MTTELLEDSLTAKDKLFLRAALQVYSGELKKAVKQNEKCELVVEAQNADAIATYCLEVLMPKLQRSIRKDTDPRGDALLDGTPMGEAMRGAVDAELRERAEGMTDAEYVAYLRQPEAAAAGLTLILDGVLEHFGAETIGSQNALTALEQHVAAWADSERELASAYALAVHSLGASEPMPDEPAKVGELRRAIQQQRGLVLAGADDVGEPAS
jgi:hypothetical protein